MAAAYAALVSLNHLIEHIMAHNARQPIFLDKQQRQMESLEQKVSFLQDFLEVYYNGGSNNDAKGLESRIADAAYAAEDIIESHVVDTIVSQTQKQQIKNKKNGKISSKHFSQGLQKVIKDIDCIRKVVMEIKQKSNVEDQLPRELVPFVSSRPLPTRKDTVVEYHGNELEQIMDMLTGQSSNLEIIPIVGMGGIGKTTLARNVYEDPLIVECFYIRAWVTISQEYDLRALLLGLLREIGISNNERDEEEQNKEYHQFVEKLYKHLSGRKYLIIMDDIWSIEVMEKLKLFFPDNDNGSRVMVTTRLLNVANSSGSSHLYKMNLLDENKSWSLLRRKVFGYGDFPPELEEIGKDIARNCKGLPLSIVVVGGLLAKSEMTRTYWEYVAKYINQIVNSEDSGHWFKILSLSYNHLPIHLKPCFLYMGVYREDCEICISELIKLWVAEGFLKPNKAKSLEEVALDYLKDLVERNLILVRKWGSIGKIKTCGIHDLLRDLCLKEAKKERFLCIAKFHEHTQVVNNERRIVFPKDSFHDAYSHQFDLALQSSPFIRSFTRDFSLWDFSSKQDSVTNLRLLRVLTGASGHSLQTFLQLVNLRYLHCHVLSCASVALSPMSRLWCLQTLILVGFSKEIIALNEIWEMPQLRHVISARGIYLPDPVHGQKDGQDGYVLKNLQTLSPIVNFNCTEEVLKRIPNIKKLCIHLILEIETGTSSYHSLHNLGHLHQLQSLTCYDNWTCLFQNVAFPGSLNKLALCVCFFDWDDFTEKVGSLPHLEKLELIHCRSGAEWNSVEGKFLHLKFFEISELGDLVCWTIESSHFPLLEHLVLKSMTNLKEIPSGLGDTLQSIKLDYCPSSVIASAKEIVEEQQSLGNEGLSLTLQGDLNPV